jgi:hypothetical protein
VQLHEVAGHELLHAHHASCAVADDARGGRDKGREPVECPLGADLLPDADTRIGDEDGEEERVLPLAEGEGDDAGDEQDQVEDREDVGPDDARVGAARGRWLDGAALRKPLPRLVLGQTAQSLFGLLRFDQATEATAT